MAETETKKYLVNVESNLEKYAKEAVEAGKKVDQLTIENLKLRNSTTASRQEIETHNAALKVAQKEYNQARRLVELQTKANNSEANSRDHLSAIISIETQRLAKLGNGYETNAKGQRVISEAYKTQVKNLADARQALINFDQAQNSGYTNVGRYKESLGQLSGQFAAMPGPIGNAAGSVSKLSTTFKALLANPIVLTITAIVGALALLVKAFKGNDETAEKFSGVLKGIGVVVSEILGRIVSLGRAVVDLFKGDFKGAAEEAKAAFTGLGQAIKEAYAAGNEQNKLSIKIEDAEIALLEKIAKRNKEIAEIKKNSRDEDASALERSEDLARAEELEKANLADQLSIQKDRVKLAEMELSATHENQRTDEQRRKVAEERAKLYDLETQSIQAQMGIQKRQLAVEKEIEAEKKKIQDAEQEKIKKAQVALQKEVDDYKKAIEEKKKADEKWEDDMDRARELHNERILIDEENKLQEREARYDDIYQIEKDRLELERKEEIRNAKKIGADVGVINKKYAALQIQLETEVQRSKLQVYSDFAGAISTLFGENTIIAKAAAVAQAIINTYLGATAAFAQTPGGIIIKSLAAGTAIATGLASVKKILEVNTEGENSAPSAVTTTAARVTAPQVTTAGTSILMPSGQISQQAQTAVMESFNMNEFTEAIKNITIVTTIEDINNKQKSTNKVVSRATI